jgi:uracil-DNA glycosylase
MKWDDLQFWQSPEWAKVQERLEQCKFNPAQENLFACLDAIDLDKVKVAIIGQDPYPDPRMATGVAFSVPEDIVGLPPTLQTILREYETDLSLPQPSCGNLSPWCSRGVLLLNAIPSCERWKSLSHDWPEWHTLTSEIIETLCGQGIVFVLLGRKARGFVDIINYFELTDPGENICIELCHPSPRASINARTEVKFVGSRMFSRINDALETLGRSKIDWRLD